VTPVESRVLRTEGENAAAPAISRTRDVNGLSLRKSREVDGETQGESSNGFSMGAPYVLAHLPCKCVNGEAN
jgi:hypothetical protein